jgi:succinate dehydrogenase flavin-adding protein (antitoxin of CptAB toxin-antitoxin module)
MRFLDHLIDSIRNAAAYNRMYEISPACILWTDKDREWQPVIDILRNEMPELFILGEYQSEKRTGPAIWLRCVLSNVIEASVIPAGTIPVIYLPGFSRQELKPVDNCPDELKILAPYQYLGAVWSQVNNKDWTVMDMLRSAQGGLGLDVLQNSETVNALKITLPALLYTEVSSLQGKQLNADSLYSLLLKDEDKSFLEWLNKGEAFKRETETTILQAITAKVKAKYDFDIETGGILTAVENFANRKGAWLTLWERFCESPNRYPNIPAQIRKCSLPPSDSLFSDAEGEFDGWPQWNDNQETALRHELLSLAGIMPDKARKNVLQLEKEHRNRRNLVWKELGESPLAVSLEYLALIAELTQKKLNAGTIEDIVKGYTDFGYRIDDAVLKSFENLEKPADVLSVSTAINAVYKPGWKNARSTFKPSCRVTPIP